MTVNARSSSENGGSSASGPASHSSSSASCCATAAFCPAIFAGEDENTRCFRSRLFGNPVLLRKRDQVAKELSEKGCNPLLFQGFRRPKGHPRIVSRAGRD